MGFDIFLDFFLFFFVSYWFLYDYDFYFLPGGVIFTPPSPLSEGEAYRGAAVGRDPRLVECRPFGAWQSGCKGTVLQWILAKLRNFLKNFRKNVWCIENCCIFAAANEGH